MDKLKFFRLYYIYVYFYIVNCQMNKRVICFKFDFNYYYTFQNITIYGMKLKKLIY